MPTIYVSNSATNGYGVGNDSNTYAQMQDKATPALKLAGAIAKAVAGDTIVINDGIYNETSYVNVTKASLTINPEHDYQVTVRAASGATRVIYQPATGTGLTLGKIIVDANNTQQYAVNQDVTNPVNDLVIDGTQMIGFTQIGLFTNKAVNITLQNQWKASSTVNLSANCHGIQITPVAAGKITIIDGEWNINGGAAVTSQLSGFYSINTIDGCELVIKRNKIIINASAITAKTQGIYASGYKTYDICDNEIPGANQVTFYGISIPNSAIITEKCWVYDNTISPDPLIMANGINICIGDDVDVAPANANNIHGIWVHGNKCANANHQALLGWVTHGIVNGNKCNNGVIGVIGKHTTNCIFVGNILEDITTGGALRMKGSNGDVFANNTVILKRAEGLGMYATDASVGGKFVNNIVYADGVSATMATVVNDGSSAEFVDNDYYATGTFATPAFTYQANNYNTIAEWVASQEPSALNIEPGFVDYPNDDLRIPATSQLYHAGSFIKDAVDFRGRPFCIKPTIGAYEVTSGDNAKPRQNRIAS